MLIFSGRVGADATPPFAGGQVRLHCADSAARTVPGRVSLSGGARSASAVADGGLPYCSGAVVPAEPFRDPTPAESAAVWSESFPGTDGHRVGIVCPGEGLILPLRRLRMGTTPPRTWNYADLVDQAAGELLNNLGTMVRTSGRPTLTGIAEHPPGLLTLTLNRGIGRRTGLHVDSWNPRPLAERGNCPNRMCLNLGESDRWFLFVNRSLMQVAGDLGVDPNCDGRQIDMLVRSFFARFPDYPVVRVKIRPGEGYLASTDNLIHDGSSSGSRTPDLAYTYHGYFTPAD